MTPFLSMFSFTRTLLVSALRSSHRILSMRFVTAEKNGYPLASERLESNEFETNRGRSGRPHSRPAGSLAECAVALAFGRRWARAQVYGRARRLLLESEPEAFLDRMQDTLGPLAHNVRVAPEDPRQTKWDAISHLAPLSRAKSEVRALW